MLTREEAKKKISRIIEDPNIKPVKTGQTLPIMVGKTFDVWQIPIDYLVPNIFNDRITWKIREFESENGKSLNIESEQDVETIFGFIENETPKDNEKTKKDLAIHGQQVDGVITNDGIIVDGNRRATLLRALFKGDATKYHHSVEDYRYFNAIVLPDDVDSKEIMALETMLQIGVDKKVEYNRICLYIKVDNLLKAGYNYTQIKEYMGLKTENDVEAMKSIYDLMVEYLEAIGKKNYFTLLDGLEDQFIHTKSVFTKLDNGTYDAEWEYTKSDVVEFKQVCYDYMRAKFEGKKYRETLVGRPNKSNGVFIKKDVWEKFLEHHNNIIDSNNLENESDWINLGKGNNALDQNLNDAVNRLKDELIDKDVSKLVHEIEIKADKLESNLKDLEDINESDLNKIKDLAKRFHKIASEYI